MKNIITTLGLFLILAGAIVSNARAADCSIYVSDPNPCVGQTVCFGVTSPCTIAVIQWSIDGVDVPGKVGDIQHMCMVVDCGTHTIRARITTCFDAAGRDIGVVVCETSIAGRLPAPTLTIVGQSSPCLCGPGAWVDVRVTHDPCIQGSIVDEFYTTGSYTNIGDNTYHVVFSSNGDYIIQAYTDHFPGPCSSDLTKQVLTVGPPAKPTISGPTVGCDELLAFEGTAAGPCPPKSWNWTVRPMTSSTVIIPDGSGGVEVRSPIDYALCLTVTNDCDETSAEQCWNVSMHGPCHGQKASDGGSLPAAARPIARSTFEKNLNITPNPAPGSFRLVLPQAGSVTDVSVVDESGKIVRTLSALADQNVSMSEWPDGNYFVVIRTPDYTIVRSIIIAR